MSRTKKQIALTYFTIIAVCTIALLAIIWLQTNTSKNYGTTAAREFETTLIKKGAIKKCSRENTGRGGDSRSPWYSALYEIPGNATNATELLLQTARENGFQLTSDTPPPNPEDNKFYADRTSKDSTYSELKTGKIVLLAEVYGSKVYSGDSTFCTVQNPASEHPNTTTVDVTFNLPEYK